MHYWYTSLTFSTTSEKSKKMYSVYHVERSFQRPYLFFFLSLLLFDFNEESQKARIAFYSIRRTEQTKRGEGGRVLREWGVILEHRFFFLWTSAKMVSRTIISWSSHLLSSLKQALCFCYFVDDDVVVATPMIQSSITIE